jgi:hypothetical protein
MGLFGIKTLDDEQRKKDKEEENVFRDTTLFQFLTISYRIHIRN